MNITARIVHIIYINPEETWGVFLCKNIYENKDFISTFNPEGAKIDEILELEGDWVSDSKHGEQFKVKGFTYGQPIDDVSFSVFLQNGFISEIGPVLGVRIYTMYPKLFDLFHSDINLLLNIKGISDGKLKKIKYSWNIVKNKIQLLTELFNLGLSTNESQKIYKLYGNDSVKFITDNPFILLEIPSYGFKTVDDIYLNMNKPLDGVNRVFEGLLYTLEMEAQLGSTYVPKDILLKKLEKLLTIKVDLDEYIEGGAIIEIDDCIYLKRYRDLEIKVAEIIKERKNVNIQHFENVDNKIQAITTLDNLTLSEEQLSSIKGITMKNLSILTGGAGTGKSTVIKFLSKLLTNINKKTVLCAPTGRAAQRISEITESEAFTIHRLLGFNGETKEFNFNPQNPLPYDFIIIDEFSMVNLPLFYNLLKALRKDCQILIIGDTNQLPPIGVGRALRDLIAGNVQVYNLTKIYRQNESSKIISYSNEIIQKKMPSFDMLSGKNMKNLLESKVDCFFVPSNKHSALDIVYKFYSKIIKKYYDIDHIQILSPMKKGSVGTKEINKKIQELLNPKSGPEIYKNGTIFRVKDKVIQLKNNYQKNIFNGDIGVITSIRNGKMVVKFFNKELTLEKEDLFDLDLAYAITIHKSQGSEFSATILILDDSHDIMVNNNLIYTAMTRGKNLVIITGSQALFNRGILRKNREIAYSNLGNLIK